LWDEKCEEWVLLQLLPQQCMEMTALHFSKAPYQLYLLGSSGWLVVRKFFCFGPLEGIDQLSSGSRLWFGLTC
jgi:hypothetical protein